MSFSELFPVAFSRVCGPGDATAIAGVWNAKERGVAVVDTIVIEPCTDAHGRPLLLTLETLRAGTFIREPPFYAASSFGQGVAVGRGLRWKLHARLEISLDWEVMLFNASAEPARVAGALWVRPTGWP